VRRPVRRRKANTDLPAEKVAAGRHSTHELRTDLFFENLNWISNPDSESGFDPDASGFDILKL
jgi:hypothetical protein